MAYSNEVIENLIKSQFYPYNKGQAMKIARVLNGFKYTGNYNFLENKQLRDLVIVYRCNVEELKIIKIIPEYIDLFALLGDLKCLKYAYETIKQWGINTCSNAAKNGHLHCLIYAHENKCPWNERTCINAARYGNEHCLKYAIENSCSYNEDVMYFAVLCKQEHCVEYLIKVNCPIDDETISMMSQ